MITQQEDIELTIKNIFDIIPNVCHWESLTESEQVALRTSLLNLQDRARQKGWADCVIDITESQGMID